MDISNTSPRLWRVDGEATPGSWTVTAAAVLIWNSNSRMTIIVSVMCGAAQTPLSCWQQAPDGDPDNRETQGTSRQTDRQNVHLIDWTNNVQQCTNKCTSPSFHCGVTYIPLTYWDRFKVLSPRLTHYELWLLSTVQVLCPEIPKVSLVDNEANIILWNIEQSVSFTRGGDRRLHACYTHTPPAARQKTDERTEHKI